jgi:hypothetical protein
MEQEPVYDNLTHCRTVVLDAVACLADGDGHPGTLHRLRTHLRRLQAYLELVGEDKNAEVINGCVSRLSSLRTLQVFHHYLGRMGGPKSDRKRVKRLIRARQAKLLRKDVFSKIERRIRRHAIPPMPTDPNWMAARFHALREEHAQHLLLLIAQAGDRPRRKYLHILRLYVKTVRYQEEWALHQAYARPDLVKQLKHAQEVLGKYQEHTQFRTLARRYDMESRAALDKDWRRTRQRARAVPTQLLGPVRSMATRRGQVVPLSRPDRRVSALRVAQMRSHP